MDLVGLGHALVVFRQHVGGVFVPGVLQMDGASGLRRSDERLQTQVVIRVANHNYRVLRLHFFDLRFFIFDGGLVQYVFQDRLVHLNLFDVI